MVKTCISPLECSDNLSSKIENFSSSNYFLDLNLCNLQVFIHFLKTFVKVNSPSLITKHTYVVLFTCFIIIDSLNRHIECKLKSECRLLISQTFLSHSSRSCFTPNSSIARSTTLILNQTARLLHSNNENFRSCPKLLKCAQFLSIFPKLSFEVSLTSILKILENKNFCSTFSLFTNMCAPYLPDKIGVKLTLVLGLEQTLGWFDGTKFLPRPYATGFLKVLSEYFELVLYTSATEQFANYCMSIVDEENLVTYRLYKQHMKINSDGPFIDISLLGRELFKVLVVDSQPSNFGPFLFNGITVNKWKGEPGDYELLSLTQILTNARHLDSTVKIAARASSYLTNKYL